LNKNNLKYKDTGVSYDAIDPMKRMAQIGGRKTVANISDTKFKELEKSRGETAYVLEHQDHCFAFVMEGSGTKSLVADAMHEINGKTYYNQLAQDTVAMIVNDLIVVGARPITVLAYWAAGSSVWFEDLERMQSLVDGWKDACGLAMATWGGGETPTLKGIIDEKAIDPGGSSFGIISPKERLVTGEKIAIGDANKLPCSKLQGIKKIIRKTERAVLVLLLLYLDCVHNAQLFANPLVLQPLQHSTHHSKILLPIILSLSLVFV